MTRLSFYLFLFQATLALTVGAQNIPTNEIKQAISNAPDHPRLFWKPADEARLKAQIKLNASMQTVWDRIRLSADHMLAEPPVIYKKEGRRLLGRSREALCRLMHLSFAARMTGDKKYVERAITEMTAMAEMPDWNPSHFLDTAEMTMAMAIGYDWLYNQLPPEKRQAFRKAMEDKGLAPYLKPGSKHGWERGGNNWNQVCHGGMVSGALALLEDDRERALEVVVRALAGLPAAMKVYDPDGTYPEGPGYWSYGTTYNVALIAMLESALGSDFALSQKPGFSKTGEFPLVMTGPTQAWYNFSDCGPGNSFSPAVAWFATRYQHPEWMFFQNKLLTHQLEEIRSSGGKEQADRFFPLTLVWGRFENAGMTLGALSWFGRGPNPLAVFRSSWTDPNALYLAVKAGSPGSSHGHMDIGSFVMDADGVRWSLDLGSQSYNAMESRGLDIWNNSPGSDRWKIFRYHNRAHSTLLVNDQEQVVRSRAPISEFSGASDNAFAVIDMTETYKGQLDQAIRRFSFQSGRSVVVEDQIKAEGKNASVRWAMVTPGTLKKTNDRSGWLLAQNKKLQIEILSPSDAQLQSWPATPPQKFDEPNPGINIVGFLITASPEKTITLKVRLTPGSTAP